MPGPDRITYTRSSGGVPANAFRLVVEADGATTAELHLAYPPPAKVTTRRGTCPREMFERLATVLAGVDDTRMRGPVPDSPNEWFEISEGGQRRAFSIMTLLMVTTAEDQAALTEIQAAVRAIVDAIGGEPQDLAGGVAGSNLSPVD